MKKSYRNVSREMQMDLKTRAIETLELDMHRAGKQDEKSARANKFARQAKYNRKHMEVL